MIKNFLLFATVLLLIPSTTFSQEVMTLEKAISIGLENSFGIKIAEKNIDIAENNNSWARAGKGPTVDLNGSLSGNLINDNNEASFLKGTFSNNTLAASLDASWVLYSGGRIAVVKDQLDLAVHQQKVLRSQEAHDLVKDISQRYADVLVQIERRQFLAEAFALSKERLAYENVKKEFGQSNSFNILQFENALTTDSINLINQDNAINIAERSLYLIIESDKEYLFSERLSITREELDKDKIRQSLEEENYTLKTLRVLAELDRLNTNLQEASRKPTVSLNGSFGVSGTAFKFFADDPNTGDPFETIYSNRVNGNVGIAANWNLYDGGLRKENIQSAKLQEEVTQLSMLQAKAQLYKQVDLLLENYNHQLNLLDLTEVQIQNARRNIELSEERFKAGQITSLDFRQVQNQFLLAANNRVNAIYNLLITKSEVDWLVGEF